ncbi:alternative ribosome rescue aminoacyl-tRNA hydrolase ArfB [Enhygromyxa salina]|uniref:Peptidyl-tRNA hydrolase ArfB n=1 Tax=Enhygromyxa salina TaxID=215803 RepID=A0A2S9YKJ3_9BACT|nr:alternative ribosome rescue aminoacyl-tRNA hydrolase ArfB [Enhygromyxa salina]PRQ05637.1 Peptidyl-tRNA hydrolase ArfB [Enhygromyxa salina]
MEDLTVTRNVTIPARELSWTAVASGGPGGQNVNKVATKVLLRWGLASSSVLPEWARERLTSLAGRRLDSDGNLLISASSARSQDRNLELARERLAGLVRTALDRPKARRPTRPSKAAKRRRLDDKRRVSQKKAGRRVGGDD